MHEQLQIVSKDSQYLGQSCIYCQESFQEQDELVACPRCHKLHHSQCWKTKGGCARTGCPQIAKTVVGDKPKGDGPPPPLSRKSILRGVSIAIVILMAMIFWPKPPDPALGRTKVTFMTEAGFQEQETLKRIIDQFNESHPDIYLDLQALPFGTMEQKLVVTMAAGETPDLFTLPYDRLEFFRENGALMNLDDEQQVFGLQHPAQLRKIVVSSRTNHPEATLEVLDYLITQIPPADLEALLEQSQHSPLRLH